MSDDPKKPAGAPSGTADRPTGDGKKRRRRRRGGASSDRGGPERKERSERKEGQSDPGGASKGRRRRQRGGGERGAPGGGRSGSGERSSGGERGASGGGRSGSGGGRSGSGGGRSGGGERGASGGGRSGSGGGRSGGGERGASGGGRSEDGGPRRRSRRRGRGREDRDGRQSPSDAAPSRARTPSAAPSPDDLDAGWDATAAASDTHDDSAAPPLGDDSDKARVDPSIRWGDDSDAPTPEIHLQPDLPADELADDPDPTSADLEAEGAGYRDKLDARVCNVIGVRFAPAGKIYRFDGGDDSFRRGDVVLVEGEHGARSGTVAVSGVRQTPTRTLKRILRRSDARDDARLQGKDEAAQEALLVAKEEARKLRLGIKVFRATSEDDGSRISIYYSCDDKTDVRRLSRALSERVSTRIDLRQTGVRDEAKMVGGIGSCGLELCCSTWLPAFVPVSIKNAKDQGLVLNPTKVSGQCGRLKCCLVYEQATYAAMRKGLPKLGKRVITKDGLEGRVVEVDVLHQRIRVNVGRGEFKIYGKGEVENMFASQPQGNDKKTGKGAGKGGRQKKTRSEGEGSEDSSSKDTPTPASSEEPSA